MNQPHQENCRCNRQFGFTVLELLVVISLVGITIGSAIPQISELKASFNRMTARSSFMQDLKRAQAESITQGCRGILRIAANGESYSFGCDYLSYDVDANPMYDTLSFTRNLPPLISIASSAPIILNSRGQAVDSNHIISSSTVTFSNWKDGGYSAFATGTLLGTGVFSYD